MSAKTQEDPDDRVRLAEARKLEAETAEIEARTEERLLRMELASFAVLTLLALIVLAPIQAALAPCHHMHGGEDLGSWLPWLLPRL